MVHCFSVNASLDLSVISELHRYVFFIFNSGPLFFVFLSVCVCWSERGRE